MLIRKLSAIMLITLPVLSWGAAKASKSSQATSKMRACLEQYEEKHFNLAFQDCMFGAEQNDPLAQYLVGTMYYRGKGVALNHEQALWWFTKSADAGNAASQLILGKMYSTGVITEADYVKALQYYSLAASQNNPTAQFLLALCYQNGLGVERDYTTALYWYQKAADNGLEDAHRIPFEATRKEESTLKYQGPGSDEYQISLDFNHDANSQDSLTWLESAANKEHPEAQYQLGMQYVYGKGVAQDDAIALHWLQKAAHKNHQQAQSYLAWMTILGLGTLENTSQAIKWFLLARELPRVGNETPIWAPTKISQTRRLTQKESIAHYQQALDLIEGRTESPNIEQGILLLEQAAQNNITKAQTYLAKLYQTGQKIKQNYKLAVKWYEKAAKNGDSDAQYALGWLYFNGQGVTKNYPKAYVLFTHASNLGNPQAKSAQQFVHSQLTPEQIAIAQNLAQQIAAR